MGCSCQSPRELYLRNIDDTGLFVWPSSSTSAIGPNLAFVALPISVVSESDICVLVWRDSLWQFSHIAYCYYQLNILLVALLNPKHMLIMIWFDSQYVDTEHAGLSQSANSLTQWNGLVSPCSFLHNARMCKAQKKPRSEIIGSFGGIRGSWPRTTFGLCLSVRSNVILRFNCK